MKWKWLKQWHWTTCFFNANEKHLVSGRVEEEILLRNEYLAAENEILKSKVAKSLQLNDHERVGLAKIGKRIGLKALREIACIVKPETILEWFRRLVAKKFDGSMFRKKVGRPQINRKLESLIIQVFHMV